MEIITGKITDYNERTGELIIRAPYSNHDRMTLRKYETVEIGLADGRRIDPEQRKKAYALMNEISEWMGEMPEYVKRLFKAKFIVEQLEGLQKNIFSLADCDMTTAREFITYLIDFILEHEIPVKVPLKTLCDDIEKYVYACLMHKRCCECGKKADLHHFDQIGTGRDRTEIYQIGMKVISLCREHHGIAHSKGKSIITDDWHLEPIPLTKEIGKVYGLSKKNLEV
jgi:hypothetical protein